MDLSAIRKTYRRYASHYDFVFGPIFRHGRKMALKLCEQEAGTRILEVGVGTGLSLPDYSPDCRVVGIDISPEMLRRAERRVSRKGLENVDGLYEMDAEFLDFPDDSFDVVMAMYVVSVVPHPERCINEMRRVCRPGGDIFILNHFASRHPVVRRLERGLTPLSNTLGFRPDLEIESLPDEPDFRQLGVRNANLFGYWKLVHYRNGDQPASGASASGAC